MFSLALMGSAHEMVLTQPCQGARAALSVTCTQRSDFGHQGTSAPSSCSLGVPVHVRAAPCPSLSHFALHWDPKSSFNRFAVTLHRTIPSRLHSLLFASVPRDCDGHRSSRDD